jgi:nickel-dependent lactate racemase
MLLYSRGHKNDRLSSEDLYQGLAEAFGKLGKRNKVLAIPPDFTRFHSFAGTLTEMAWQYYGKQMTDILPALGTHVPMTKQQIEKMFGKTSLGLFRVHDWRHDIVTVGEVPADFVKVQTGGLVDFSWPAQVNKLLINGSFDLILSIGQVVPHEVIGMANYNKNIFVGTGGVKGINKSHFVGAVYGMERIMGRADNPVRRILNYASDNFTNHWPIIYIQTVINKDENGKPGVCGMFIGDDMECFVKAAELSLLVNFEMLDKPLNKVVVYLDPEEFKSTWVGNKSIYRTRMAIADAGELIVLAPGLHQFGEDKQIDSLIRKYGYLTTPEILELTACNDDLKNNLSATAHLIHGSSEGRFKITYCPGHLSENEIRNAHFNYAPLADMMKKYDPHSLKDGYNSVDGEEIFYISNPALGLWAYKDRFRN